MKEAPGLFEKLSAWAGKSGDVMEEQSKEIAQLKTTVEQLTKDLAEEREALHGAQAALAEVYGYMQERKELNPQLEDNLRNNNVALSKMENRIDMQEIKLKGIHKSHPAEAPKTVVVQTADPSIPAAAASGSEYDCIDYFDFENHFRGSRAAIKDVQTQYLPYFEGRSNVLDLGCGRGEFLELLGEHGIDATGVECYPEFAEFCRMRNLKVAEEDALSYLRTQEKVGGIFAGQLIEHLKFNQIVELCELGYEKLEDGGYLIMETPNPMSLAIYTHAFYMDPSHNKPIHPFTMEYFMKKVGFKEVEILFTESSRYPVEIPKLAGENIENLEAFNKSMEEVSHTLFGSQDYAIIGRK